MKLMTTPTIARSNKQLLSKEFSNNTGHNYIWRCCFDILMWSINMVDVLKSAVNMTVLFTVSTKDYVKFTIEIH